MTLRHEEDVRDMAVKLHGAEQEVRDSQGVIEECNKECERLHARINATEATMENLIDERKIIHKRFANKRQFTRVHVKTRVYVKTVYRRICIMFDMRRTCSVYRCLLKSVKSRCYSTRVLCYNVCYSTRVLFFKCYLFSTLCNATVK